MPSPRSALRAGVTSPLSLGPVAHLGLSSWSNSAYPEILWGWGLSGQKRFKGCSTQAICGTEQTGKIHTFSTYLDWGESTSKLPKCKIEFIKQSPERSLKVFLPLPPPPTILNQNLLMWESRPSHAKMCLCGMQITLNESNFSFRLKRNFCPPRPLTAQKNLSRRFSHERSSEITSFELSLGESMLLFSEGLIIISSYRPVMAF